MNVTIETSIKTALRCASSPMSMEDLVAATGSRYTALALRLGAMVKEGTLYRPSRGRYALTRAESVDVAVLAEVLASALRHVYPGAETEPRLIARCRTDADPRTGRGDVRAALINLAKAGKATLLALGADGEPIWSAPIPGYECNWPIRAEDFAKTSAPSPADILA